MPFDEKESLKVAEAIRNNRCKKGFDHFKHLTPLSVVFMVPINL